MSDIEEQFGSALHNTSRAWRQALDKRLKHLGVSQASWISMVDRLVKAGLVYREPSSTDRRVKRIVLTQAGNLLFDKVREQAVAFRKELLADIDKKKLGVATEVLDSLQGILDNLP